MRSAILCLSTTIAVVTLHEVVHISVGHALGIGGHFTSLTSADADSSLVPSASPVARAAMAGAAPVFTAVTGFAAWLAAPWARRRRYLWAAATLGWIAVFSLPYVGVQLMTLAGPGGGVDTAAVLVGYFHFGGAIRTALAVAGIVYLCAVGWLLDRALGDGWPVTATTSMDVPDRSRFRQSAANTLTIISIGLIAAGAVQMLRAAGGNPMAAFLLANLTWAAGMLVRVPWRRPGPQLVWKSWLAPGLAAMSVLTIVGVLWSSDYAASGLFFLPQLATAAYAARDRDDSPVRSPLVREQSAGIVAAV